MTERFSILVQLLARTDALFLPSRSWSRPGTANRYTGRRDFPRVGVSWTSGGLSEHERRRTSRELERMAGAHLVTVHRPKQVKTLYARLPDAADESTRALVALPGLYGAWFTLLELAKHSTRPAAMLTDAWIPEHLLVRNIPDGRTLADELRYTESFLLPALVRGLVVSNANIYGAVSYALTPTGWEWLDKGIAPPDVSGRPSRAAQELYKSERASALQRLDSAALPNEREIGGLPLPVATGGLPIGPYQVE